MLTKLIGNLGGAIGSRYLKNHNQLVFVEWTAGAISRLDLIKPQAAIVSSGSVVLKGTWLFDCETGLLSANMAGPADIWWEQIDNVKRQMTSVGTARIVNLGPVNFNNLNPGAMQLLTYSATPIPGNNDATNKLTTGDVFCVQTKEGNFCKVLVVQYGYDMTIQWVTYKLASGYAKIGTGYTNPEDIAVLANEKTAYVTERAGNFLKVDLANANRAAASVVVAGLHAPHQIQVDEAHKQAYVVEFANPGRLLRINLTNGALTVLNGSLNLGIGLVITSDLTAAYVSEQGANTVSRIDLSTGVKTVVATGLTSPFFMAWSDDSQSSILIAERDPANRISLIDLSKSSGNVKPVVQNTGARPSSVSVIQPGVVAIACDAEIDKADFMADVTPLGLYKGIGYVPFNLITAAGKADTTTQPLYPFQFPKDSPFGGTLPVLVDHHRAWEGGLRFYRVLIDNTPRLDVWNDLTLNFTTGQYDTIVQLAPQKIGAVDGFYAVHDPSVVFYNTDLGCLLPSTTLSNAKHTIKVEFYDGTPTLKTNTTHALLVDNNQCVAILDMPVLDGNHADPVCGVLKYVNKTHVVTLKYTASHPNNFATYSFTVVKGASTLDSLSGPVAPPPPAYTKSVSALLGQCTVAAFAEYLYVATTVINGVGRQSQYDASALVAFCLAP